MNFYGIQIFFCLIFKQFELSDASFNFALKRYHSVFATTLQIQCQQTKIDNFCVSQSIYLFALEFLTHQIQQTDLHTKFLKNIEKSKILKDCTFCVNIK